MRLGSSYFFMIRQVGPVSITYSLTLASVKVFFTQWEPQSQLLGCELVTIFEAVFQAYRIYCLAFLAVCIKVS